MTKIAVQTKKYDTTRHKGVHSISLSEKVSHADFAPRAALLKIDPLVLLIDETVEEVGEV
jgi:hypothetical protein